MLYSKLFTRRTIRVLLATVQKDAESDSFGVEFREIGALSNPLMFLLPDRLFFKILTTCL